LIDAVMLAGGYLEPLGPTSRWVRIVVSRSPSKVCFLMWLVTLLESHNIRMRFFSGPSTSHDKLKYKSDKSTLFYEALPRWYPDLSPSRRGYAKVPSDICPCDTAIIVWLASAFAGARPQAQIKFSAPRMNYNDAVHLQSQIGAIAPQAPKIDRFESGSVAFRYNHQPRREIEQWLSEHVSPAVWSEAIL
jgi:hypothetical protein